MRPTLLRIFGPFHAMAIGLLLTATSWAAESTPPPDLEEVVVTATPLRVTPEQTAQPVLLLGGDPLLQRRAASLGETLSRLPGVSATYFGPQASRPLIRGLGGERVQMYEDGADSLDVSGLSDDHAVAIDPLLADRIEVVRGPASLLFGNGASAGVVNVVTRRVVKAPAADPFSAAFELRGDSASRERALLGRADFGTAAWRASADLHDRRTDDLEVPRDSVAPEARGRLANSASESRGRSMGISAFGNSGFVSASAGRFDTEYGIPGEDDVRIDMQQQRYRLDSEWRRGESSFWSKLRAQALWNNYEHREVEGDGATGTLFRLSGREARLSVDHAERAGWRGVLGTQLREVDLEVVGEEAFVPASRTRNAGLFLFESKPLGNDWTLEGGARLERQDIEVRTAGAGPDYSDTAVSVALGAVWRATPVLALTINATSTERHPAATELYADGPHLAAGRFEIGDSTLGIEAARTLDAGLRWGGRWRASVSAFVADYRDFIFAANTDAELDDLPVVQYRTTDARFRGLEFEFAAPSVALGAARLDTRVFGDYVRATDADGQPLPRIPPLRFGSELALGIGPLSAQLDVLWNDRQARVAAAESPTAGATLLGGGLIYSSTFASGSMRLFLRGDNLLNETARRHTSPLKAIAPLPGRSLSAGIRMEF